MLTIFRIKQNGGGGNYERLYYATTQLEFRHYITPLLINFKYNNLAIVVVL